MGRTFHFAVNIYITAIYIFITAKSVVWAYLIFSRHFNIIVQSGIFVVCVRSTAGRGCPSMASHTCGTRASAGWSVSLWVYSSVCSHVSPQITLLIQT